MLSTGEEPISCRVGTIPVSQLEAKRRRDRLEIAPFDLQLE